VRVQFYDHHCAFSRPGTPEICVLVESLITGKRLLAGLNMLGAALRTPGTEAC
jgi:hypothetical protein